MSLASRLRTLREHANLGQADVAAELDVSIPTVSEWESGKTAPSLRRIPVLAKLYGVTADYLLIGRPLPIPDLDPQSEVASLVTLFQDADEQVKRAVMTLLRAASRSE
jgi:transcriptional regulator with XRE-family HTH domain